MSTAKHHQIILDSIHFWMILSYYNHDIPITGFMVFICFHWISPTISIWHRWHRWHNDHAALGSRGSSLCWPAGGAAKCIARDRQSHQVEAELRGEFRGELVRWVSPCVSGGRWKVQVVYDIWIDGFLLFWKDDLWKDSVHLAVGETFVVCSRGMCILEIAAVPESGLLILGEQFTCWGMNQWHQAGKP